MRSMFGTPWTAYLAPAGFALVVAGFLAMTYGLAPPSRAMPVLVGWAMALLVALDLVQRSRTRLGAAVTRWLNPAAAEPSGPASGSHGPAASPARAAIAMAWVVGFTAALVLIGILAAVPLFVFARMRFGGRRALLPSAGVAAATTLIIWALFAVLLRLPLYPGVLFGDA